MREEAGEAGEAEGQRGREAEPITASSAGAGRKGAAASSAPGLGEGQGGAPGLGLGWHKVAQAVAEAIPREELRGIWVFQPMRHEEREWGTAVVLRRGAEGQTRFYTARYMIMLRGRERGQGKVSVDEVGAGPDAVIADVLRGVQHRAGETEPPVEVDPGLWFDAS